MEYNAREMWNSSTETDKFTKASLLYSEVTGYADNFFNDRVHSEDLVDTVEECLGDIRLDYISDCLQNFRRSKLYKKSHWGDDETGAVWAKSDADYTKLLDSISNIEKN